MNKDKNSFGKQNQQKIDQPSRKTDDLQQQRHAKSGENKWGQQGDKNLGKDSTVRRDDKR